MGKSSVKELNVEFMEAYKSLDKKLSDMYGVYNGVTNYIDIMKETPVSKSGRVTSWENDLKSLKTLRHSRNILSHEEGAFEKSLAGEADIQWIKNFEKRVDGGTDPLAVLHHKKGMGKASNLKRIFEIICLIVFLYLLIRSLLH